MDVDFSKLTTTLIILSTIFFFGLLMRWLQVYYKNSKPLKAYYDSEKMLLLVLNKKGGICFDKEPCSSEEAVKIAARLKISLEVCGL